MTTATNAAPSRQACFRLFESQAAPVRTREFIQIQTPDPKINYRIDARFIEKAASKKDERGEYWTFMVYKNEQGASAADQSSAVEPPDLTSVLERYVRDNEWPAGTEPHKPSIDLIVRAMRGSPDFIKKAIAYADRINVEDDRRTKSGRLKLSNFGLNRFVQFTPSSARTETMGRILDLHYGRDPVGLYALIEWIVPGQDKRRRQVSLITEAELRSMRELSETQKSEIEKAFSADLTTDERAALKLAEVLRMQTFGYTDPNRGLGQLRSNGTDAMTKVTSQVYQRALRGAVEADFGSITDLMTEAEASDPNTSVYDVLGRYSPRYILQRFHKKGSGYLYAFVITEDGLLKVTPNGQPNMKPNLLRLALGRRVYGAGTFELNLSGKIAVRLDATEYQSHNITWERARAFHTEHNGDLHKFISSVFYRQTGYKVASVAGDPVALYSREDDSDKIGEHGRDQTDRQRLISDHASNTLRSYALLTHQAATEFPLWNEAVEARAQLLNARPYILLGKFNSLNHKQNSLTRMAATLSAKLNRRVLTFSDFERHGLAEADIDNIILNVQIALTNLIERSPGERPIYFNLDGFDLEKVLSEKGNAWAKPYSEQEFRMILRRKDFFYSTRWLKNNRELSDDEVKNLFDPYLRQ